MRYFGTSLVAQTVKRLPARWKTWVQSLGQEDPLEKEMATHSSTLAWKIPRMEEPGGLQSMGSQRVGHDSVTSLHLSFSISPSNEYLGLISFRIAWFDHLAVQEAHKSLLQHHSSKASILRRSAFFTVQLSYPYKHKKC